MDVAYKVFASKLQVNKDPVCDSGHCHITPYLSGRLRKKERDLLGFISDKIICCRMEGNVVFTASKAVMISFGELAV